MDLFRAPWSGGVVLALVWGFPSMARQRSPEKTSREARTVRVPDVKLLKRLSEPLKELVDYEIHKGTAPRAKAAFAKGMLGQLFANSGGFPD